MLKQGENLLWDYFKISNEDVSIAVCIFCKKNLSRRSKDPHKMTTTTNLCRSQSGFGKILASAYPYFLIKMVLFHFINNSIIAEM